jgi:pimeloyl-ACP methyl ester carboxylesterase
MTSGFVDVDELAFDNLHELTMDESAQVGLDPPAIERLEQVAVPTLILPADRDPRWLQRVSRVLGERIPDARTVAIPDVDHVINLRRPEAFDAAVLPFLAEVT